MQGANAKPEDLANLITILIDSHPIWAVFIILLLSIFVVGFAYLLLKERFSKRAKDIAEAGKLMGESLKHSTEALASVPQIVQSFETLVENTIRRELADLDQRISQSVENQFQLKAKSLEDATDQASSLLREIENAKEEAVKIKEAVAQQHDVLNEQLTTIYSVLPEYEIWKNIADPELLLTRLTNSTSWEQGKDLLGRIKKLVEDSNNHPEQIPAKYIESTGDWCRRQNQYPLALWFYDHAVQRDPQRVTAKVEYYALQAEFIPDKRESALSELKEIVLSQRTKLDTILRVFNVFIEIDRYDLLIEICTDLLSCDAYQTKKAQAKIYRNRAVAIEAQNLGTRTDQAWEDMRKSYELVDNDEDTLRVYSRWLMEDGRFSEAIEKAEKSLGLDLYNVRFYLLLAEAYSGNGQHDRALEVLDAATNLDLSEISSLQLKRTRTKIIKAKLRADPDFPNNLHECVTQLQLTTIIEESAE